jgi:predicted nucleotidyltransferase
MDRKVILEKIGLIVGNFPEVEAAYVFGSFMDRDDFRDIDVALLVSEKLSPYMALKLAMHIGSELDFGIKIGHDMRSRTAENFSRRDKENIA